MFFSKALLVASLALSALASPHMARRVDHRAVAHRAAMPDAAPEPVVVPAKKKRANSSRCKVRSSSSSSAPAATSSSIIIPPQNVESTAAASSEAPATTSSSTKAAEPTTTATPTSTKEQQTTTQKPTTTKTSSTQKATSTQSSGSSGSSDDPLGILTGDHDGQGTYYATGLGSCGITNADSDYIAAVSHELYDNYPGYDGANPNNNPLCKRQIKATYQGKSVTVQAVDRCTGCAIWDLDFSPSAFQQLADLDVGRLSGLTWEWV